MKTDLAGIIATLTAERDTIDRAIRALKGVGSETRQATAAVKPAKRRKKRSAEATAKFKATMLAKRTAAVTKANGQAGQPTSVPETVQA